MACQNTSGRVACIISLVRQSQNSKSVLSVLSCLAFRGDRNITLESTIPISGHMTTVKALPSPIVGPRRAPQYARVEETKTWNQRKRLLDHPPFNGSLSTITNERQDAQAGHVGRFEAVRTPKLTDRAVGEEEGHVTARAELARRRILTAERSQDRPEPKEITTRHFFSAA